MTEAIVIFICALAPFLLVALFMVTRHDLRKRRKRIEEIEARHQRNRVETWQQYLDSGRLPRELYERIKLLSAIEEIESERKPKTV